ncbi:MAG: hypothetical protein AMS16_06650 [Planctomycetes bacterium DG_58]|nr:MAG: hypothetical protein AMS16_06650 [Planctomycetes bacterium DG_58]
MSGQAFRWRREEQGFVGVVRGQVLRLEQRGRRVVYRCAPGQVAQSKLRRYLGLDAASAEALRSLPVDAVLGPAIRKFAGMRILQQDPWETLISFIISSNNSITRTKKCIERLCRTFGKETDGLPGFYSFPSPQAMANASLRALRETCNLGYRDVYARETARTVARNPHLLSEIARLPYPKARGRIVGEFLGVGNKVADCVLLYSMGKYEAFPVDRWVKRIIEDRYYDGTSVPSPEIRASAEERFGRVAGYAQLYLFQYALTGGG